VSWRAFQSPEVAVREGFELLAHIDQPRTEDCRSEFSVLWKTADELSLRRLPLRYSPLTIRLRDVLAISAPLSVIGSFP
jgi:hypothetical protein